MSGSKAKAKKGEEFDLATVWTGTVRAPSETSGTKHNKDRKYSNKTGGKAARAGGGAGGGRGGR